MFVDRAQAGARLAAEVAAIVQDSAVVLGIPRGGVVVAAPVAQELKAPLDVVVPRKLGAPGNPELGIGAVAPGVLVLDERLVERLRVPAAYIEAEVARQEEEIARRTRAYRGDRPPPDLSGKTAVIVDDGAATGGTASASLRWARDQGARRVVLAVPVAPPRVAERLSAECDDLVVLLTPRSFFAVGEWYDRFDQVTDDEVMEALGE